MSDGTIDKEMDLSGLPCPMPVIKVSQAIKQMAVGESLKAISTDPGSLADFPAWARSSGNEIVSQEKLEGKFVFIIKKIK